MVFTAWKLVKKNQGGFGVDRISLKEYERDLKNNLYKLWIRLNSGSYHPLPVKVVAIPKGKDKIRKLGIPTVEDRIAQMVIKQCLEPRFEKVFHKDSYGYRPKRSALGAIKSVRNNCWKYPWVLDMDIQGFFDTLDHKLLLKAIRRHVPEKWIRMYLNRWLEAPMQELGILKERTKGTPQGGVISPLLANLYLHYTFDKWMEREFPNLSFVRYADDIIVHGITKKQLDFVLLMVSKRMKSCGLRLHPEKTKIVYCQNGRRKEEATHRSFKFLGYTFQPRMTRDTKGEYRVGFLPAVSIESKRELSNKLRRLRIPRRTRWTIYDIAKEVNPMLRGWINYFGKFYPSALNSLLFKLNWKLMRWVINTFKRFKRSKKRAIRFLKLIYKQEPKLFAHWEFGIAF